MGSSQDWTFESLRDERAARQSMKKHDWDKDFARLEQIIVMRTHFTGDYPYVGTDGLVLALKEALDERDVLRNYFTGQLEEKVQSLQEEIDKLRSLHGICR